MSSTIQLNAVLRKTCLQRQRAWTQLLCEILAPLLVGGILIVGWIFSLDELTNQQTQVFYDATQPLAHLWDMTVGEIKHVNDSTIRSSDVIHDDIRALYPLVSLDEDDITLTEPNCARIPDTEWAWCGTFEDMETIGFIIYTYKGPLPHLPFDRFVSLHKALNILSEQKNLARALDYVSKGFYLNLLYLGRLSFAPVGHNKALVYDQLVELIAGLNATHPQFNYTFGELYESEEVALKDIQETAIEPGGRTWALLTFKACDVLHGNIDFAIRMNYSTVPSTSELSDYYDLGFQTTYQMYVYSGFLSIQEMIADYVMESILAQEEDIPAARSTTFSSLSSWRESHTDLMFIPASVRGYQSNAYYTAVGPLAGLALVMSMLYPFSKLVKSIVEEKERGMKDVLIIMGLNKFTWFSSWCIHMTLIMCLSGFLLTVVLQRTMLPMIDFSVLLCLLWLFTMSLVPLAMCVSLLFSSAKVAGIFSPFVLFVLVLPRYAYFSASESELISAKIVTSVFCPPTAFAFGMDLIMTYAAANVDLTWNVLHQDALSMSTIMLILCFDIVAFSILALAYHGLSMSCCKKSNMNNNNNIPSQLVLNQWKEKAVVADNVTKVYDIAGCAKTIYTSSEGKQKDSARALDGVSFSLPKQAITTLLGHNGAGKTTLMRCLTGLQDFTSGIATIHGLNVDTEMSSIRQTVRIGYCPQHDVLWPELTVWEHLVTFSLLKAGTIDELALIDLMKSVGLDAKRNARSCELSGGMRRKLCCAMALCGNSQLVLLDEPTTGVDPHARRSIWTLLEQYKEKAAILLSTHQMSEAEALSDRVLVLHEGMVKATGTLLELKSQFDVGYVLSVNLRQQAGGFDGEDSELHANVHALVMKAGGSALHLRRIAASERVYNMPYANRDKLVSVLQELERPEVQALWEFGVSATTLEEVFMASWDVTDVKSNYVQSNDVVMFEEKHENEQSVRDMTKNNDEWTVLGHLSVLVNKRFRVAMRDIRFLLASMIVPLLLISAVMAILKINYQGITGPELVFTPEATTPTQAEHNQMYYNDENNVWTTAHGQEMFNHLDSEWGMLYESHCDDSACICDEFLDSPDYGSILGGIALNDALNISLAEVLLFTPETGEEQPLPTINSTYGTFNFTLQANTTVIHNSTFFHAIPTMLTSVTQATLRAISQNLDFQFRVSSFPIPLTVHENAVGDSYLALFVALFLLIPLCYIPASYSAFLVQERISKFKHVQLLTGLSLPVYWLSHLIFDFINFAILMCLTMILFVAFDDQEFIGTHAATFATIQVLLSYGLAIIPLTYCFSRLFTNATTAQVAITTMLFTLGFILVIASFVLDSVDSTKDVNKALKPLYRISPGFALGESLINLCMLNYFQVKGYTSEIEPPSGWSTTGRNIVYLLCSSIGYSTILLMLEHGFIDSMKKRVCSPTTIDKQPVDDLSQRLLQVSGNDDTILSSALDLDVRHEEIRIDNLHIDKKASGKNDLLVLSRVHKYYGERNAASGYTHAVRGISLGISRGVCFGFLGENGAGKTTSMKMITGDESISSGSITIEGLPSSSQTGLIGYCPQYDPILDHLTGREHIIMFCILRNVPKDAIERHTQRLLMRTSLINFADKPAGSYSGGNKRKLSLALALVGDPPLLLLDEPSSGMDPMSRRKMWGVISGLRADKCIMLTSHSLADCEALCDQMTIMVHGQLRCLGSLQHLRNRHADGYIVTIQSSNALAKEEKEDVLHMELCSAFPGAVESLTVGETHVSEGEITVRSWQLPFTLANNTQLKVSAVFAWLATAQENSKLDVMEYSVSQVTLEDIFIRLTKASNTV